MAEGEGTAAQLRDSASTYQRRQRWPKVASPYALRGRLYCGFCGRRMQGQYNHGDAYYRCQYPKEYALASHVRHPANVYLREADVLPAIDRWLTVIFAPRRLTQTIAEMQAAQAASATPEPAAPAQDTRAAIADCDARLARYQATLDAGADRMDPPGQSRARRSTRPRGHPDPPQAQPPAHRRRHPRPHHRPRQPARSRPRRRANREGSHLRPARTQGHLQARARQTPGRGNDQPGAIRRAHGAIWGYGSCPRGDRPHTPTLLYELQRRDRSRAPGCCWVVLRPLIRGNGRLCPAVSGCGRAGGPHRRGRPSRRRRGAGRGARPSVTRL